MGIKNIRYFLVNVLEVMVQFFNFLLVLIKSKKLVYELPLAGARCIFSDFDDFILA